MATLIDLTGLSRFLLRCREEFSNRVDITWSELKSRRDSGKLKKGMQYRITDYQCTTTQAETRSANHPFDIIVTADEKNKLNENATAAIHSGDTYFSEAAAKLEAWKLKYCLDNDRSRFAWADTVNGKGVVYWMKDEWDNECPYDFKNIQFKRYAITNITGTAPSTLINNLKTALVKSYNGKRYFGVVGINGDYYPENTSKVDYTISSSDYDWYYTFQGFFANHTGGTFDRKYDLSLPYKLSDECIDWMNSSYECGDVMDCCRNNIIQTLLLEYDSNAGGLQNIGTQVLNDIVFLGDITMEYYADYDDYYYCSVSKIYENRLEINCHSNTFGGYSCHSNTFGNNCCGNIFGGFNCYSNTFGNNCRGNIFGGYSCHSNTFGNNCYMNTFGNSCYSNTFGYICCNNTFGNQCYMNTFGNNYQSNTFGNNCSSNIFGNDCLSNTFGNYCRYNTFGNDCQSIVFGSSSSSLKDYYEYITIEPGVKNINLSCTATTNPANKFRNVTVAKGMGPTSGTKTISNGNVNQNFLTVYQPNNTLIVNG